MARTLALSISVLLLGQGCDGFSPKENANGVTHEKKCAQVDVHTPGSLREHRVDKDQHTLISRTEEEREGAVDEGRPSRVLDKAGEKRAELRVPTSRTEQRTWPRVDVRDALRALDEAGEVGTFHHMQDLEHYFTDPIPFDSGQPAQPSPAEQTDLGVLLAALKHDNTKRNATYAWEKLVRTGSPAVPHLVGALGSQDHQQRILASSALGRIGGTEAAEALVSQFKDDDVQHNALAAYLALAAVGREALPQLRKAARSADRQQATFARCLISTLEVKEQRDKDR